MKMFLEICLQCFNPLLLVVDGYATAEETKNSATCDGERDDHDNKFTDR